MTEANLTKVRITEMSKEKENNTVTINGEEVSEETLANLSDNKGEEDE